MPRTYLGFGFGAIQAGLFLSEAQSSGNFDRLVVAYRRPAIIKAVRDNAGYFMLNVAHDDHIEKIKIGPIEIYDVNKPKEREKITDAIAVASEIATAVSSTKDYFSNSEASIHKILAEGLTKKLDDNKAGCVIYAAENDNHAAEILQEHVINEPGLGHKKQPESKLQFLNTVIGKMSITIRDTSVITERGLATITPSTPQAFLVENFSHILIDKIKLAGFERGIKTFVEKEDLTPFEEAKLYGHNAIHAMAAYLAMQKDLKYIKDLDENTVDLLRRCFRDEIGAALIKKYSGVDEMFSSSGFEAYANNLIKRMQNPFLNDTAERVGRDVKRKLAWNDRLVGAMRLCLSQGVEPKLLALGVVAALETINKTSSYKSYLESIWQDSYDTNEAQKIYNLLNKALGDIENIKLL